jgi:hypothetical protein
MVQCGEGRQINKKTGNAVSMIEFSSSQGAGTVTTTPTTTDKVTKARIPDVTTIPHLAEDIRRGALDAGALNTRFHRARHLSLSRFMSSFPFSFEVLR